MQFSRDFKCNACWERKQLGQVVAETFLQDLKKFPNMTTKALRKATSKTKAHNKFLELYFVGSIVTA